MFTARNRQNAFAKRRRAQAEAEAAEAVAAPEPVAVPFDRNAESEEYEQAPDISTYAPERSEPVFDLDTPGHGNIGLPVVTPSSVIDAETQAKIDAVMNHAIPPVADEPVVELVDEPKRGRGRPRPQETIDRDNAVHTLLVGADAETGISKESIAAELDEKEQQVYSSLRQLTKEGRAETRYVKPHGYRWFAL